MTIIGTFTQGEDSVRVAATTDDQEDLIPKLLQHRDRYLPGYTLKKYIIRATIPERTFRDVLGYMGKTLGQPGRRIGDMP